MYGGGGRRTDGFDSIPAPPALYVYCSVCAVAARGGGGGGWRAREKNEEIDATLQRGRCVVGQVHPHPSDPYPPGRRNEQEPL